MWIWYAFLDPPIISSQHQHLVAAGLAEVQACPELSCAFSARS